MIKEILSNNFNINIDKEGVEIPPISKEIISNTFNIIIDKKEEIPNSIREELKMLKDRYDIRFLDLKNIINQIISDGKFDENEKEQLTVARTEYNESYARFNEVVQKALDSISNKKAENESEKVDKKYAEIILDPENGILSQVGKIENTVDGVKEDVSKIDQKADRIEISVSSKVDSDEIISSINMSTEGIKIKANKVDITGLVTFNDLSTPGSTTINGANIVTGTINAEHISGKTLVGVTVSTKVNGGSGAELSKTGLSFFDDKINECGKMSYDSTGSGSEDEARNRLWIRSLNGYAMKIESNNNMSISVPYDKEIYMGGLVNFTSRGINCKKITTQDPFSIYSNNMGVVLYNTGVKCFEPDETNQGKIRCGSSWSPWESVTAKSTYSMDGVLLNKLEDTSHVRELRTEDVLDKIKFKVSQSKNAENNILMDITNIQDTSFANVDEYHNASINQSELLKLALFEIQKIKESIRLTEGI